MQTPSFAEICSKAKKCYINERNNGINTFNEKILHHVIKLHISNDLNNHEIKLKSGIADVLVDNTIYEVQTGSVFPLKNKIKRYLLETDYNIVIVCPVEKVKYVSWIDPSTGDCSPKRKSPKKVSVLSAIAELIYIQDYILNDRVKVKFLFLEMEEYRLLDGWSKNKKRGSSRVERYPISLFTEIELNNPTDYLKYFPVDLQTDFTAKDFGIITGLKGKKIYACLNVYVKAGVIIKGDKNGRSFTYKLV